MLGLLSRGLEFWLRQQCDGIEQLEIQLAGSASQLLRGRLDGVRLVARRVVFQALQIEHVELQSEPIRVRMGALLRTQMVQLQEPFRIQGQVALSSEGLSHSLSTPPGAAWGMTWPNSCSASPLSGVFGSRKVAWCCSPPAWAAVRPFAVP